MQQRMPTSRNPKIKFKKYTNISRTEKVESREKTNIMNNTGNMKTMVSISRYFIRSIY
jgi:hypothetical protein